VESIPEETLSPSFDTSKIDEIDFGRSGLVPAVIQDVSDGAVLMVAYMDAEALRRSLSTGRTWFYSRSRKEYWCKGETSGNRQHIVEAYYDCDADTLLFKVVQEGSGACHTGNRSCFFRSFSTDTTPENPEA
jgi:phosphoribosyl-AMP cyclohydrolase